VDPDHVERRLAAILAADVAGYSRLMEVDEEGTHVRLMAHRRVLVDPSIAEHRGHVIKNTGDGALVEFASIVDAVRCAVDIQRGMMERNADVPPAQRIEFRIGINLGDVMFEEGDVYGDGVNVAARLEALAEPNGICVSRVVRDQVRDKLGFVFEDLGEQRVKNIARPVEVHRVRFDTTARARLTTASRRHGVRRTAVVGSAVLAIAAAGGGLWWWSKPNAQTAMETARTDGRASFVVLPFANLSGDPAQDYLADGLTESLTTDLSRLRNSRVIARGTAFTYKGKLIDVRQIGRELGARYVLEGSVAAGTSRLRVNAQLLDVATGTHVWAERIDAERGDVLRVQDEILARVAMAVGRAIVDAEARRAAAKNPEALQAIDWTMRGQAVLMRPSSRENDLEARGFFDRALKLDDRNVDAMVGVASTHVIDALNGYIEGDRTEALRTADAMLQKALLLDPAHIGGLYVRCVMLRARGRVAEAVTACQAVLDRNPASASAHKEIGYDKLILGRADEALAEFEQANRLDPGSPQRWTWLQGAGLACLVLQRDEEAIRWLEQSVEVNPSFGRDRAWLAAAYALTERDKEARDAMAEFRRLRPRESLRNLRGLAASDERVLGGLRKAGVPEP
jgi:class 3 adenylate cyclase/TolB-like protein/Flp pilus assembly protein TadD